MITGPISDQKGRIQKVITQAQRFFDHLPQQNPKGHTTNQKVMTDSSFSGLDGRIKRVIRHAEMSGSQAHISEGEDGRIIEVIRPAIRS